MVCIILDEGSSVAFMNASHFLWLLFQTFSVAILLRPQLLRQKIDS